MASASVLNTENATQNTVMDREKINDLPLNGRIIQLSQLVPGVAPGLVAGNSGFTLRHDQRRMAGVIAIQLHTGWRQYD